jgi:hypothetical protein
MKRALAMLTAGAVGVFGFVAAPAQADTPDPHGGYWPCDRLGRTCVLPVPSDCNGLDARGHTVCPLPSGSAGSSAYRHRIPPRR